jgi:hypothetical protein
MELKLRSLKEDHVITSLIKDTQDTFIYEVRHIVQWSRIKSSLSLSLR